MTWYSTLIENGSLQRCKSHEEREELKEGCADHLRDCRKDEKLDDTHTEAAERLKPDEDE